MNTLTLPLFQAVVLGILALCGTIATAIFAYRQAVRVAERQAHATESQANSQIQIKRLEIDAGTQNLFHSDLVTSRAETSVLNDKLRGCEKELVLAGARLEQCNKDNARLEEENRKLIAENQSLLMENRQWAQKAQLNEWLHHELTEHPEQLRALLEQIEKHEGGA